ncbi:MAG: hypothetical protein QOI24_1719 [Acidobacteriota bacterium]|jgi:hypothetical protein|nr:hypothetical protein [Acidobacteriota bacterium]
MSWKKMLAKALILGCLEIGALSGVPIRPEEIEAVMKMSQPKVVHVVRNDEGDAKEKKLPR